MRRFLLLGARRYAYSRICSADPPRRQLVSICIRRFLLLGGGEGKMRRRIRMRRRRRRRRATAEKPRTLTRGFGNDEIETTVGKLTSARGKLTGEA